MNAALTIYFAGMVLFIPFAFVHGVRFRKHARGTLYAFTFGLFYSFIAAFVTAPFWPVVLYGLWLNARGRL